MFIKHLAQDLAMVNLQLTRTINIISYPFSMIFYYEKFQSYRKEKELIVNTYIHGLIFAIIILLWLLYCVSIHLFISIHPLIHLIVHTFQSKLRI